MLGISVLVVALVCAFFIVWLYQYGLSYITLTADGLVAVNWHTLFHKQNVQAEWIRVQDVSVVASGFFAQMLGFGTLNIQTAGVRRQPGDVDGTVVDIRGRKGNGAAVLKYAFGISAQFSIQHEFEILHPANPEVVFEPRHVVETTVGTPRVIHEVGGCGVKTGILG